MNPNENKDNDEFEATGLSNRMKPNDNSRNEMPINTIENVPLQEDYKLMDKYNVKKEDAFTSGLRDVDATQERKFMTRLQHNIDKRQHFESGRIPEKNL
jgi:hypothetical protein